MGARLRLGGGHGRRDALGEATEDPGRRPADRRTTRPARAAGAARDRIADEHARSRVRALSGRLVAEARRIGAQDAVAMAQQVRDRLAAAGVALRPFAGPAASAATAVGVAAVAP